MKLMRKEDRRIVISTGFDDNYACYAAVMIKSIIENLNPAAECLFALIDFGLKQENKDTIMSLSNGYENITISFFCVPDMILKKLGEVQTGKWSIEIYSSILACYVLSDVDKYIYIDCDVVNIRNIEELYRIDIEGYLVGATKLLGTCVLYHNSFIGWGNRQDYFREENDFLEYFNNGVMLINSKMFRQLYSFDNILDRISDQNYTLLDQDLINELCRGKVFWIDASWNCYPYTKEEFEHVLELCPPFLKDYFVIGYSAPSNIHFTVPVKPWNSLFGSHFEYDNLFWYYASLLNTFDNLEKKYSEYCTFRRACAYYSERTQDELMSFVPNARYYLYGYGKRGHEALNYFDKISFEGIIENNIDQYDDPCHNYLRFPKDENKIDKESVVIIANDDYKPILEELLLHGYSNVFLYKHMRRRDYFIYNEDSKEIIRAYATLEDSLSKKVFEKIIQKRVESRYNDHVKAIDIYEGNTFFNSVLRLRDCEEYYDIGGDEDTIRMFKKQVNGKYNRIKLIDREMILQTPYWEQKIDLNRISLVRIDVLDCLSVLKKIQHIIEIKKPKLSINVSNDREALWMIPTFVKRINNNYKIYMRHHSTSLRLTVLYAVCEEKNG